MRMYDIIAKKRDGSTLTDAEIRYFVREYTDGRIPDYQAAALCMAIYFRGMTISETAALTLAVRDSGEILDLSGIAGFRVDKHSTGGVGDKTSFVVAPIVASYGVKIAKMSGRGLGHTGGTVDKLEAIPGLRVDIPTKEFAEIVKRVGIAIVGQNALLAPADKKLYALRDVTATVNSIPLIASSIMGKKLAANDDGIVLDVKTGSGSFMKTLEKSRELAHVMVGIGKEAGKQVRALVTDMDRPLGRAIGNTLEVIEAIETLQGKGPQDLSDLSVALAAHMLVLSGKGDYRTAEAMARAAMQNGTALQTLAAMVEAQGGDADYIRNPARFRQAAHRREVLAPATGYLHHVNAEEYGAAALLLGAGRNTMTDVIDHAAGIYLHKKTGDLVKTGEVIATLYTEKEERFAAAEARLLAATTILDAAPAPRPLIFDIIE